MLMVDVDRFKAVNDREGHQIGDQILIGMAKIISETVGIRAKATDIFREEFAVLLPNYTTDEGLVLAEIIRKRVEQSVLSKKKLNVTVSIGLGALPDHAQTPPELVQTADSAMYDAKKLGRI